MCKDASQITFSASICPSVDNTIDEATFFEVAKAVEAQLSTIHHKYQIPYLGCSIFTKLADQKNWSTCANDKCPDKVVNAKKAITYKIAVLEYILSPPIPNDSFYLAAEIKRKKSPYINATCNFPDIQSLKRLCYKSFSVCDFLYGICAAYRDKEDGVFLKPTWNTENSIIEMTVLKEDCAPQNFNNVCLRQAGKYAYQQTECFCQEIQEIVNQSVPKQQYQSNRQGKHC